MAMKKNTKVLLVIALFIALVAACYASYQHFYKSIPAMEISPSLAKVIIYSADGCIYCDKAKKLLVERNIEYVEYDINQDPSIYNEMLAINGGQESVPHILINNKYIGGYSELKQLDENGEL